MHILLPHFAIKRYTIFTLFIIANKWPILTQHSASFYTKNHSSIESKHSVTFCCFWLFFFCFAWLCSEHVIYVCLPFVFSRTYRMPLFYRIFRTHRLCLNLLSHYDWLCPLVSVDHWLAKVVPKLRKLGREGFIKSVFCCVCVSVWVHKPSI